MRSHTEAVTPVFGRADLLSAFFVLAGWCLSLEGPSLPLRRRLTIALLFVAGLLAKESAVALLAVIVVSDLLRANAPERSFSSRLGNLLNQRRGLYVALGLALTGYTLLRFAAVGGVRASGAVTRYIENPLVEAGPLQGVATALWVAAKYVLLFLVPYPLAADYSYRQIPLIQSWTDPRLLALLIAASCAVLVVALWRRAPLAALGLIAFSLLLAPVSNVFFTIGTIMAERVLYLPSVGLCLLAGWAVSEGMSRAPPVEGSHSGTGGVRSGGEFLGRGVEKQRLAKRRNLVRRHRSDVARERQGSFSTTRRFFRKGVMTSRRNGFFCERSRSHPPTPRHTTFWEPSSLPVMTCPLPSKSFEQRCRTRRATLPPWSIWEWRSFAKNGTWRPSRC